MDRKITAFAAVIILIAGFALAAEETRWVNVTVNEHSEGTNVEVHLPLSLVLSVLKSVDVDNFHRGHVDLDIDDADIDWAEIFAAVKDAPDGQFVTVDSHDAKVSVSKQGGTLLIDVDEIEGDNAKVKVTVPVEFMDALSINDSSQIDVAALLESFDRLPNGDLVTVESDEANVRVWIE
jgi:ribonuclease PH